MQVDLPLCFASLSRAALRCAQLRCAWLRLALPALLSLALLCQIRRSNLIAQRKRPAIRKILDKTRVLTLAGRAASNAV